MKKSNVFLVIMMALVIGACTTTGPRPDQMAPDGSTPSSRNEESAKVHVDLGLAFLEVGGYETALEEANIALRAYPNYAQAYHLKGMVYIFLEQTSQAHENFRSALRFSPNDPDINNTYGWFLCSRGNVEEGLSYLTKAASNPYYRFTTRPYTNMGYCYLHADNLAQAESSFIRALEADSNNPQALFELANIAYDRSDYLGAKNYLLRLHQGNNMNAASVWLGLKTERKLGNRGAEESYAAQLKGRFSDSNEYRWMQEGRYE